MNAIASLEMVRPTTTVLEAHNLYRFFHTSGEETLALRGVSLSVSAGEVVAVTGPSGSGKSTLLACLTGLDEPDGGMVRVAGHDLSRQPEAIRARIRARHIGMMFQTSNLFDHLTVEGNVRMAQRLRGVQRSATIATLLATLGIAERSSAYPSTLSGGELARAGLAVALANDPDIIVADEPTGELDADAARSVLEVLLAQARGGAAVVVVTHNADVAAAAHREISLRDGTIATTGTP
jgi:putative ABC transport system ATP-binding protein